MYSFDQGDILGFQRPALPHVNACRKMHLEINFIYLDNKKIYCMLYNLHFMFHKMPSIS